MADDALVNPAEGIAVKTAQRVRRDNPQSDFVRYQDEGRFRVFSDDREELIQLWGENGIRVFFGSDFRERDHDIGRPDGNAVDNDALIWSVIRKALPELISLDRKSVV